MPSLNYRNIKIPGGYDAWMTYKSENPHLRTPSCIDFLAGWNAAMKHIYMPHKCNNSLNIKGMTGIDCRSSD